MNVGDYVAAAVYDGTGARAAVFCDRLKEPVHAHDLRRDVDDGLVELLVNRNVLLLVCGVGNCGRGNQSLALQKLRAVALRAWGGNGRGVLHGAVVFRSAVLRGSVRSPSLLRRALDKREYFLRAQNHGGGYHHCCYCRKKQVAACVKLHIILL